METLETFSVNAKNKCITFLHEKKKIKLHDLSIIVPLSQTTDEESTNGRYEELEEKINLLSQLIMDKYNYLEHVHRKRENQNLSYVNINNRRKNSNNNMMTLRRHISWKLQKSTRCYQAIPKKFFDYEIITKH